MSGNTLFDMIAQAQGGGALESLGRQNGLNAEQASGAVSALLPAISSALRRNTSSPDGLASLLGALQSGNHQRYIDEPEVLEQEDARADGNAILGHLFGGDDRDDVAQEVTRRAAESTGVGQDILSRMLPAVAAMAMGSLSRQTQGEGAASQLAGAFGGGDQSGGVLGAMMGALTGGDGEQGHGQAMGMLGRMLDADGDGSVMDDVFDMVRGRRG